MQKEERLRWLIDKSRPSRARGLKQCPIPFVYTQLRRAHYGRVVHCRTDGRAGLELIHLSGRQSLHTYEYISKKVLNTRVTKPKPLPIK